MIGRNVELDGVARRVVGVMPRGFALPTDFTVDAAEPKQIYVPLQIDPAQADERKPQLLRGRDAEARRDPRRRRTARSRPSSPDRTREGVYPAAQRFTAFAVPVEAEIRGGARRALSLVFGAVGFLLLMACANVANLLLARAEGRQREISVRAAIGAGKARLVRQLLTESLVLAAAGGVLGLGVAWVGVRLIAARGSAGLPALAPLEIQPGMLLFSAALAVGTTLLFGLAPALRLARLDLTESLRDGAGGATAGLTRHRLRASLAVLQIALAVVLLLGAGLMIRTLAALSRVDLGFDPERFLTLQLRPPEASYPKPEQVVAFYRTLLDSVRGLPGVKAAGLVRSLPARRGDRRLGRRGRGLRPSARRQRQGRLAGALRRRARGARREVEGRPDVPGRRRRRLAPGRSRQRDVRANLLAGEGPDRTPASGCSPTRRNGRG